ncbi:hypothetical protein PF008_g28311 [Phytophthora fragariae]|uniref:SWIM-type domain-containing protein n=1 Tax=Phytophthora fragariae TaxID=53985 RepID=A0A6G0QCD3_9STRA|nr:hypothetical protein PF008_g28311 [Phytophthora fragariae]
MLAKAQRLGASTSNYRKLNKGRGSGRRLVAIIFNAAKFTVRGAGILGAEVAQQRAEKFVRSLEGKFPIGLKALEIEYELLSLHRVTIGTVEPEGQLQLDPVWSMTNIQIVRSYVQCDCESYVRTGSFCSHALAALSLQGFLDLKAAMAAFLSEVLLGGRQIVDRLWPESLERKATSNVDRLVRLFLQRTGQPLKWKVIADMEVEVEGDISKAVC